MQKISLYLILLSMLYCGGLLLYRATLGQNNLVEINSKVLTKQIEVISTKNQNVKYGLIFKIENYSDNLGIFLGTKNQALENNLIKIIDKNKIYTFRIDQSVWKANGVNLGLREISLNGTTVYKESNKFTLLVGIFFVLLALGGLFIVTKYTKKKNGS